MNGDGFDRRTGGGFTAQACLVADVTGKAEGALFGQHSGVLQNSGLALAGSVVDDEHAQQNAAQQADGCKGGHNALSQFPVLYAALLQNAADGTGHAVAAVKALADLVAEVVVEVQLGNKGHQQKRNAHAQDHLEAECTAGNTADHGDLGDLLAACALGFFSVAEVAQGNAGEHGNHQNTGQQGPCAGPILRDHLNTGLAQNLGADQQAQKAADHGCGDQEFTEQGDLCA